MKIQPVEFPLGIGIADELRVIINEGVAYYTLVDNSKITIMHNGSEFPFKILHSSTFKIEDEVIEKEDVKNTIISKLGLTLID